MKGKFKKAVAVTLVSALVSSCSTLSNGGLWKPKAEIVTSNYVCQKEDASFTEFIEKFSEDKQFQESRYILPMVSRIGSYSEASDGVYISLLKIKDIHKMGYSLFRSSEERKKDHIKQETIVESEFFVEVLQYLPNADADQTVYKFKNIYGCWYLEEFHDSSL